MRRLFCVPSFYRKSVPYYLKGALQGKKWPNCTLKSHNENALTLKGLRFTPSKRRHYFVAQSHCWGLRSESSGQLHRPIRGFTALGKSPFRSCAFKDAPGAAKRLANTTKNRANSSKITTSCWASEASQARLCSGQTNRDYSTAVRRAFGSDRYGIKPPLQVTINSFCSTRHKPGGGRKSDWDRPQPLAAR